MIASDEIIVPHAGQGISDSPSVSDVSSAAASSWRRGPHAYPMIASDEIIVPHAGHAISDSPAEADSTWTATFATGFAICATATGTCAAAFVTAGAGLDGTG